MVHNRRRGGAKDVIGKKIPVATAIPVVTAVPEKTTQKLLKRMKKGGTWMKVENWLMVAKLVTVVGVIIFVISTASGQVDGELAAYYWMAIGVVTTLVMTTVMLARTSKGEGVFSLITKMAGLYLPTMATLVPIAVMIYIFQTVRSILVKDATHLPPQFYTFHYLTFFFLFLQLIMLYQFFGGEVKAILSKGKIPDPNKWAYVSAFIFICYYNTIYYGRIKKNRNVTPYSFALVQIPEIFNNNLTEVYLVGVV